MTLEAEFWEELAISIGDHSWKLVTFIIEHSQKQHWVLVFQKLQAYHHQPIPMSRCLWKRNSLFHLLFTLFLSPEPTFYLEQLALLVCLFQWASLKAFVIPFQVLFDFIQQPVEVLIQESFVIHYHHYSYYPLFAFFSPVYQFLSYLQAPLVSLQYLL